MTLDEKTEKPAGFIPPEWLGQMAYSKIDVLLTDGRIMDGSTFGLLYGNTDCGCFLIKGVRLKS